MVKGIEAAGFEHPTSIQAELIPMMLAGRDILGQAKTGTGKTAAFSLPMLHQADKQASMQALVLAPTRELAAQLVSEINELGHFTPIQAIRVVGGESVKRQAKGLSEGAHLMIGTPGRVMDMLKRRKIRLDGIRWVVLDEVDRMLDIGFRDDIRKILGRIKHPHQTIFCSATISDEIERLGRRFMRDDAHKIVTHTESLTVSMVAQNYLPVKPWDKKRLLLHVLQHEEPALTLVFCRTKRTVDRLARYLRKHEIDAYEIHGDLPQAKRNRIMQQLRSGKLEVLVASDLASRGLDVENISHIINYDLPDDPEVYVHRIGRTARAGRSGVAWSFVEPTQGQLLSDIEKLAGVHIEKLDYPDFEPGEPPEEVKREMEQEQAKNEKDSRFTSMVNEPEQPVPQEERFPGGVVPKGPPRKTLGSRFRTRRR